MVAPAAQLISESPSGDVAKYGFWRVKILQNAATARIGSDAKTAGKNAIHCKTKTIPFTKHSGTRKAKTPPLIFMTTYSRQTTNDDMRRGTRSRFPLTCREGLSQEHAF
jgi:hypothetical protein